MKTLALFSIFSPRRLGIADYSDDLAEALASHFEVTCYVENRSEPDRVRQHATVKSHADFKGREDYVLHQIGNSAELSFLLPHLVKSGGVVTLHDSCQHDITYPYFKARRWRFWMEVIRSLDRNARRTLIRPGLNPFAMMKNAVVTYEQHPEKRRLFPFTRFILRHADRVIIHSHFLREMVRTLRPGLPAAIIPHGIHPLAAGDRASARRRLRERYGLPVDQHMTLFLSFGAIQAHKRIAAVLEAFKTFLAEQPTALYLLVGPRDTEYDVGEDIAAHGLGQNVKVLDTYLPMAEVNECITAADLCFNLRWPSLGSTSGTLYKIFAVGRPSVVTRAESFADYPDDFVLAVPPPGEGEREGCLAAMRAARDDPERIAAMGKRARAFVKEQCSWGRIAEKYVEILTGA